MQSIKISLLAMTGEYKKFQGDFLILACFQIAPIMLRGIGCYSFYPASFFLAIMQVVLLSFMQDLRTLFSTEPEDQPWPITSRNPALQHWPIV
jgi:hypothetical protein